MALLGCTVTGPIGLRGKELKMKTITLNIDIPDQIVTAGGIELFASSFGWTPTVKDDVGNDVANPI